MSSVNTCCSSPKMTLRLIWINLIIIVVTATLTGCETTSYYGQAIAGQMIILNKRQPIKKLLAESRIPVALKAQLERVLEIRKFAESQLFLPVGDQYHSFADLERPFAVWNVFAAPEFSLTPEKWCYPVIGCMSYRGYFSRKDAIKYAHKLRSQGYDVFVSGVAAYSTLGWFDDPVLNTFVYRKDIRLAALIFHELAHHLVYVKSDTTFNESFATFVEQEGLRRWLNHMGNPEAFQEYERDYFRRQKFVQLIMKYRRQLELLYSKTLSSSDKRRGKTIIFAELRSEYERTKEQWQGYAGYDNWFRRPLNNAQMTTVSLYNELVPAFAAILEESGNDLALFYGTCQRLADESKAERKVVFEKYLKRPIL